MRLPRSGSKVTAAASWRPAAVGMLTALTALVLMPTIAGASCAGPVSVQDAVRSAPTVFVGTVTGLSNGDRVATVRVDDVWRGAGILSSTEVAGSPDLSAAATSVDRTYSVGAQYLFIPESGGPDHYTDNTCTATQPYAASLAALRPAGAVGRPTQAASAFPLAPVLVVASALLIVVAASAILLRRWRHALRDQPARVGPPRL